MNRLIFRGFILSAFFLFVACDQSPSRPQTSSPPQEGAVKPSRPEARACDEAIAFQSMLRRMREKLPNSELEPYGHVERQALISAFLMNEILRVYGGEDVPGFNSRESGRVFVLALDVLADTDAFWREKPNYEAQEECFGER